MTNMNVFSVLLKVLINPVVICTTFAVIIYLNFVVYVQRYRKKPPKVRKAVQQQVKAAKEEAATEQTEAAAEG